MSLVRSRIIGFGESSDQFVSDIAQTSRQMDEKVPLIVDVDKSFDVEAVKASLSQFNQLGSSYAARRRSSSMRL